MNVFRRLRLVATRVRTGKPPIGQAMDDALAHASEWPEVLDLETGGSQRLVCVSDLHRGKRDGADDHRRAERVYNAALQWYLRNGYTLAILGDAEDFWEGDPEEILVPPRDLPARDHDAKGYLRSLELEAKFNEQGRYIRLYGNHDGRYRSGKLVDRILGPFFLDKRHPIKVYGAVKLNLGGPTADAVASRTGRRPVLLLVHGHQGDLASDILAPESSVLVRGWAWLQAKVGAFTAMPSEDAVLRNNTSKALHLWALHAPQRPILIAGHTHEPVFATATAAPATTEQRWAEVEAELEATIGTDHTSTERAAVLELMLGEFRRRLELKDPLVQERPCYFNTGACCYGDGQISTLEIADGTIRLVRWAFRDETAGTATLERVSLQEERWGYVLERVHGNDVEPVEQPGPFDMRLPKFVDLGRDDLDAGDGHPAPEVEPPAPVMVGPRSPA